MLKHFALTAVTGFLALFGTNEGLPFPRPVIVKSHKQPGEVLPLNGQLLTTTTPDLPETTVYAPAPTGELYGVEVTGGGEVTRRKANEAARTEILSDSPDTQTLRAYSGGGGLGESADQFYTPKVVADLLWDMVTPHLKIVLPTENDKKPPVPVRVLEPSCGNGAVIASAPAGVHITGVEMDVVAARAARALHPHASIHAMPFEQWTTRSAAPLFDVVLGNPPYVPRGETRDLHEPEENRAERYFLRQMLRRVKHQTGLVSLIMPLAVLHNHTHTKFRAELLTYGLPIHAAVVPTGAFKAAGAGVTTAILVMRRHDYGVQQALSDLEPAQVISLLKAFCVDHFQQSLVEHFVSGESLVTSTGEQGQRKHELTFLAPAFSLCKNRELTSGRYDNPMLEGEVDASRVTSAISQVSDGMKAAPVVLNVIIEGIRSALGDEAAGAAEKRAAREALHAIPEGTLSSDRKYAFRLGEWVVTDDFASPPVARAVEVAQALQAYLEARDSGRPDTLKRRKMALALDNAYRAQFQKYAAARFTRLIPRYSLFAVLLAHLSPDGALELPLPQAVQLPITATDLPGVAEQLADLLALTEDTLAEYAQVTPEAAAQHLTGHYCFNGELWVESGIYYVGHAFVRAEQARALAEQHAGHRRSALLKQADTFISKVRRVKLQDVTLSPRDAVIPVAVLEAWVNDFLGSAEQNKALISVRRENGAVKFRVKAGPGSAGVKARDVFDQEKARGLEKYLNHKTEVDQIRGASEMSKEQYKAERALAVDEAQAYEDRVAGHFTAWLANSTHVQVVEDAYTYARGAVIRPTGSMRPLHLPGWHGPQPHPYQAMDVRAMAATTGMVNNYDVGLGKTFTTLALVTYLKGCGKASRPVIVVPAGLVSNWATNARLALPDWNITTVGMSPRKNKRGEQVYKTKRDGSLMLDNAGRRIEAWMEDSPAVKREKIARLSAGKTDLIIMSREAFTSIPMQRETRQRLILTDAQYQRNLETQDAFDPGMPRRGKHQELVKQLGVFGAMMARVNIASEGELSFELLGCDFIAYDEAHGLKNLYAPPTTFGETPRFLGGGGESQRALDALHKGRYVRERSGSTFSFTASWIKNSPLEVYSMLSMVMDNLMEYGLPTGEALMEQYLRIEPQIVTGMDGSVDVKPCVVGFRRLKELKGIISGHVITRSYGEPEVITCDGKLLQVPSAVAEEVMIDMTDEQLSAYKVLRERARNADAKAKGPDHPFSILWEMRKLTVDPVLLRIAGRNPRFEKITELALENRAQGGKGLVFLSIGEKEGSFKRLKDTLVTAGYPAHEIAIVSSNTHKSSVDRQNLEDDYNFGDLTLILGTDVLGQGFNLQNGTSLIINADIPWNYEEIRQRVGRGARQGNPCAKVRNVYLLMRGSFDSITYTIMSGKKSWLSQLWLNVDELENTGAGFNGEEMALLLSDDVEATKKAIAEKKTKLEELTGRAALRRNLETLSRTLIARDRVTKLREDANARKNGWTARDHAKIGQARDIFLRMKRELDLISEFSFTRLVNYTGEIHWIGVLPVHVGMTFQHEGKRAEVTQVTEMNVNVLLDTGQGTALNFRQVAGGTAHAASVNPAQYREALSLERPTISLALDARVFVLDAQRVNPVPKDADNVVTVSVHENQVRLQDGQDKFLLRSVLITGGVIMHYGLRPEGTHLVVTQVAVLTTDARTIENAEKFAVSGAFRDRLLQIIGTALGAETIKDRAKAA